MDKGTMGARIRSLRQDKRMTMEEMGEVLHVSSSSVHNWEMGHRQPDLESIAAMCRLFGTTSDYLLGLEARPEAALNREEATAVATLLERWLPESMRDGKIADIDTIRYLVHAYEKCRLISDTFEQSTAEAEIA